MAKTYFETEWRNAIDKAAKALNENNIYAYENAMNEANLVFEDFKKDLSLTYDCTNFGMANAIVESKLVDLFKNNKKAVKEITKLIKEDKNLNAQFNFFEAINKCPETLDAKEYIKESLSLVDKKINKNTLRESNAKLNALVQKYNIKPSEQLSEENLKLYEACDHLFRTSPNLSNLASRSEKMNVVVEYAEKNKKALTEAKNNVNKLIEDFEHKYGSLLNEEEKSFVQEIIDWKGQKTNENKTRLFNKLKNECIAAADKLIKEASDEEKEGLEAIKEQISNKEFCQETIVKDVAKMLEIRDVLMDK